MDEEVAQVAARARRELSGRVLAATLRSVRDLDIAEESTADAFLLALQSWPTTGIPASVEAWLVTAARRRAVDRIRRAQLARRSLITLSGGWSGVTAAADGVAEAAVVGDDELRMVVLCCDPRLPEPDQVALTLRLACGVSTAGIAAGYGISTPTMAARLTRAKAKLADAGPMLDLPDEATVDARLPAAAKVVHLAFTLGHTCGSGLDLTDDDLADRAQYLAGVLHALRPATASLTALLALILLTRARSAGRFAGDGDQLTLADADRGRWDRGLIKAGVALLAPVLEQAAGDPLVLQAAIAAEHSTASSLQTTDWHRLLALYSRLLAVDPSPGFALGRCIAVSYAAGPAAGLDDLDEVLAMGVLNRYPYAPAARAQMLERLGRSAESVDQWRRAAGLARTSAERAFFEKRAAHLPPIDRTAG
jgi:RNA polymerase sigma-70 factor (ECF subfamily)